MTPPIRVYTGKNVRVIVDDEAGTVEIKQRFASGVFWAQAVIGSRADMRGVFELLKEIFETREEER